MRNRPDLGQCQGDDVGGKGHGFGMKIPARDDARTDHQRIVRDGIGLGLQRGGGKAQKIHGSADDLRHTADAIRVLHAGIARQMAVTDHRSRHDPAHLPCHLDLAAMAAKTVDFGLQRRIRPHDRIG